MARQTRQRLASIFVWWVTAVRRVARWVVLLWSLATVAALYYAVNELGINTDTAGMISSELRFRKTFMEYERIFPQYVNSLVLVVDGKTPELADHATQALAARLRDEPRLFKTVYVPGGGAYFERHGLLYQSPADLETMADELSKVQPFLAKLSADQSLRGVVTTLGSALDAVREGETVDLGPVLERVTGAIEASLERRYQPLSWRELMLGDDDPAHRRRFVLVQPRVDYSSLFPAAPAIEGVRRIAQQLYIDQSRGVRLRITGAVALDHEELQSVSRGARIAAILALVMVIGTLMVGLRSGRLVFTTLLTLVSGLILTAAFAAAAVGHLNLISVAFAVLYIGLGVDFAIHLCMRYQELIRTGEFASVALSHAVRDVGPSLLLCAVTTAAAFFAFIPTAYSGVAELGLIAGTGMFISLASSVTFLPALIDILRPPRRLRKRMPAPIPELLAQLPLHHGVAVRLLALLLGVTALAVLPQARFDYDPINLRDAASESVATFKDLMAESTTSPLSLVVLAPDAAHAALYVKRLSELDVVDDAVSLQSFIPDEQEEKLAIIEDIVLILGSEIDGTPSQTRPTVDEQRAAIRDTLGVIDTYLKAPGTPLWRAAVERLRDALHALLDNLQISEQAAQTQLMSRLDNNLLGSLPESLDRLKLSLQAGPVQAQDLPSDLVQRWVSNGGIYRIEVYPKEDLSDIKALRRFVSAVRSVAPNATGEPILMLESGNAIVTTFQRAFVIALLVISMVLLIEMRSAVDTVLVLVPLIFGALLTGAALVILQIPFNFANIIALPLLLGIGVDNGIHMIRRMRSTAMSQAELLRSSTARAMVFSALTTICSFGNLSFSSHPGTASMGQILTIGVSLTLLATLIVLPALLKFSLSPKPAWTRPYDAG